jgi:hypothetical protein
MMRLPSEKLPCRRSVNPHTKINIMGDKSPKANQKKSSQKQAIANRDSQQKKQIVADKQASAKKR